jgi:acetoin utilization deacetylase AcuC-like enzyme
MMRIGLAAIPSQNSHPAPRAHPERYERLLPVLEAIRQPGITANTVDLPTSDYDLGILKRIHTGEYIERLAGFDGAGTDYLDPDTYRTAQSFRASCDVTWALLSAIDAAHADGPTASFIIGRPPGHHAEADYGMGFCLVNHIAVAAQYELDRHKSKRVAVIDIDVHHGNGTQHIFYDRCDVLYVSTHQYPFYPGTGAASEIGRGEGEGFTANFPLPAGTGDTEMLALFDEEIIPLLNRFAPSLILVSAGFDGHRDDLLGGFLLTGHGFGEIARRLSEAAARLCEGRLVSLMEGGYTPEANVDSVVNYLKGLASV